MSDHPTLAIATIGLLAAGCRWAAWRFRLPPLLLLLPAGLLAGPILSLLDLRTLFGSLLTPLMALGVVLPLFDGVSALRTREIHGLHNVVRGLVTVGLGVTWVGVTMLAHLLGGLGWSLSILCGTLALVSGTAVVMPVLRSIRPVRRVADLLRGEAFLSEALGAMAAVLFATAILTGAGGRGLLGLMADLLVGVAVGWGGARLLGRALRRHAAPQALSDLILCALLWGVFSIADALSSDAGLLAVMVMAVVAANSRDTTAPRLDTAGGVGGMVVAALVIVAAACVDLTLVPTAEGGLAFILASLLLVRPAAVVAASRGSDLPWRERLLLSVAAPRGILPVVLTSYLALRLQLLGDQAAGGAAALMSLLVLATLLAGLAARPLARRLGLAEPQPNGVLIVGAHRLGRTLADALAVHGFTPLLADTHWEAIREARLGGIRTHYGEVSLDGENPVDLTGIGYAIALTPRASYNALVCAQLRHELGADRVYAVRTPEEQRAELHGGGQERDGGLRLFGGDVTLSRLMNLLEKGGGLRPLPVLEPDGFHRFMETYGGHAIPLFAVSPERELHLVTPELPVEPGVGWIVVVLWPPEGLVEPIRKREAQRPAAGASDEAQGVA